MQEDATIASFLSLFTDAVSFDGAIAAMSDLQK